ncbi:MAG: amidase family protein, partial [Dehalococcoidia bacterium]
RPAADFAAGIERAGEPRADGDRPLEGVALAVIPSLLANTAPGVLAAFEASLEMLRGRGATVREVEAMPDYLEWRNRALGIMSVESYEYAEHLMTESPETIGEPVRRRIAVGATTPAHHYSRALDARKLIERRFEETLATEALDGYVLPTSPITAFPIDADAGRDDAPNTIFQNTTVFDLTHQPAISVPNGFDEDGLPTGLMVAGSLWQDAQVLRIGDTYQRATDFHLRRPKIAHASNVEA